jgi:hypothetical protein
MNTLIQANVFFFVTTVAIAVLSILLIIAFVYVIRFLRDLTDVSKRFKEKSTDILKDIDEFRASARAEGTKTRSFLRLITRILGRKRSK